LLLPARGLGPIHLAGCEHRVWPHHQVEHVSPCGALAWRRRIGFTFNVDRYSDLFGRRVAIFGEQLAVRGTARPLTRRLAGENCATR